MTKKDLKTLIDDGYDINKEIKALEKELETIKGDLKIAAEKKGIRKLNGFVHSVLVSPSASSEVDTEDAHQLYIENGHSLETFLGVCSVSVPQLRKQVGEMLADDIVTTKTKAYGKITFRKDLVK